MSCRCSTRIKDAGIAIRHSRGYTFSILQGPGTDLREWKRCVDAQKTANHIKQIFFSDRKTFWGRQTGWKTRAGSAGIDNEAHWSCKRWVTANVVQNDPIWVQNQENAGFKILGSGIPKFSRRRPTQPSRPVGFQGRNGLPYPNKSNIWPARGQIYEKMLVLDRRPSL